jgi:hypothetical protein
MVFAFNPHLILITPRNILGHHTASGSRSGQGAFDLLHAEEKCEIVEAPNAGCAYHLVVKQNGEYTHSWMYNIILYYIYSKLQNICIYIYGTPWNTPSHSCTLHIMYIYNIVRKESIQ